MGGLQAFSGFAANPHCLRQRDALLLFQEFIQRCAFEELHRDERDFAVFADMEDRDDVIVLNLGGRPGFSQESVTRLSAFRVLGQHDLQCHGSQQIDVFGKKHHPHAARTELLQDAEMAKPADFPLALRRREQVGNVGAVTVEDRRSVGVLAVVTMGWRPRERRANDGVLMLHGLRHGKLSMGLSPRQDSRQNKLPNRIGADEEDHESTKARKHEKMRHYHHAFSCFHSFVLS